MAKKTKRREARKAQKTEKKADPLYQEFQQEIAKLERKIRRLALAVAGKATVRRVWREAHSVRAHSVRGHWATYVVLPGEEHPRRAARVARQDLHDPVGRLTKVLN